MAARSKDRSRRANYPILTQGGSDEEYRPRTKVRDVGMRRLQKRHLESIGGQVLVPAAAVIPAPIAYIKIAAVKKLVVGVFGTRMSPGRRGGSRRSRGRLETPVAGS